MSQITADQTKCTICNSQQVSTFTRRGARYARCRTCQCISRLITPEEYGALEVTYDADPTALHTPREELRSLLDIGSKRALLEPFVDRSANRTRFLDIGCGLGGYMIAARDLGCDVTGVEPSAEHAALARTAFDLDVRQGYFEAEMFPPSSFDLIMLSHVIEHIYDPNTFLARVLGVLVPGGQLIVVTPNSDSLVARLSGRFWTMLKPVDHVRMLSARGLRRLQSLEGHSVTIRQSEYLSEPLTGLLAAARDALQALGRTGTAPTAGDAFMESNRPLQKLRRRARQRPVLGALAAASVPFHLFNIVSGRQACLVCVVRKAA